MKILMTAYACEPNKGSEPEVGWRWMLKLSKECKELVVVTRKNNKATIESCFSKKNIDNVQFLYFDLPKFILFFKKGSKGAFFYAYLWEVFLFLFLFKRFHKKQFDVVQRVTFVSYRIPSFISYFGKQFVFGPIAGGERFSIDFLKVLSFRGKIKALVRILSQRISTIDPLVLFTLYKADKIIAVTGDTKSILPVFFQKKVVIMPAISIDKSDFVVFNEFRSENECEIVRLLYVGRLIEWKGIMLSLMSLKNLPNDFKYEFNIIGSGADEYIFESYAKTHNLNVNFLGELPRKSLSKYYSTHDLLLFPSLHDSGGMVVLEAKAHGLSVVVSDFGGPKMFTDDNDLIIKSRNVREFVADLHEKILGI